MTARIALSVALSVSALAACATAPQTPSPIPSNREVVAYVTSHWESSYRTRLGYRSERRGQPSVLVSVKDVACQPDGEYANCTFMVTGRFPDGAVLTQSMDSMFGRQSDGSIEALIPVVAR